MTTLKFYVQSLKTHPWLLVIEHNEHSGQIVGYLSLGAATNLYVESAVPAI